MTKTKWACDDVETETVVEHLKTHHQVAFDSRNSLSEDEFIQEHFPSLIKDIEDRGYNANFLSEEGRKRIATVRGILRRSLKFCEQHSIPIARVADQNATGDFEWRICKPTMEQLDAMKNLRYFAAAEGFFNKVVLQAAMLSDETDIDALLAELKEQITVKQNERLLEREAEEKLAAEEAKKTRKKNSKGGKS